MSKWQPVMIVADKRIECQCMALAIFVIVRNEHSDDDVKISYYCQDCWVREQEEEYEEGTKRDR